MTTTTTKACIAILALATVFAVRGAEWYVDPVNGLDTLDGTTSNVVSEAVGPRKTLEKAMELVKANDTLWLLPGEYNEGSMNSGRARINVAKANVKVKSTAGAAKTFIVGSGGSNIKDTSAMQCARVASGSTGVIFEGITFKDGCARNYGDGVTKDNGGGLGDYTDGHTWVIDCVFTNCYANMGGGMYFGNAIRCRFVDCYTASDDYGCAISRGKNFAFCLFYNCSTNYSATFCPFTAGNKFYNCTFYGKEGNAFCQNGIKHSVLNSIIVGYAKNGSAGMYATNCVMGSATCADTFNCVTGVSVADSGLVSPSEGDFRVNESTAAASLGDVLLLADFPAPTGYSLNKDLAGKLVPLSGPIPAGCLLETRSCHLYVDCVNGSDSNDGSAARPYKTIRAATTNALSGDVIHVAPGTYGAAEGTQKWPDASSAIGTRVVIPAGVTVESTGGAANTFIVGAASPNPAVTEGWQTGIGPDAVRCVVAHEGAVLRGFTVMGGYTHVSTATLSEDRRASAFIAATARTATIEDCVVTNNVANVYTISSAIVRRCRVVGNTGAASGVGGLTGAAGADCKWYGSVIAGNRGDSTVWNPFVFENCTIGGGNIWKDGSAATALTMWGGGNKAIVNCAILAGGCKVNESGKFIYCTNCLIREGAINSYLTRDNAYNTIFTNSTGLQVDSEYRPVLGSFAGIDAGDAAYSSEALGDKDIYGTPRILNGQIDIGAVEYDWRPTFAHEIGKRFNMTYASPSVTTNAAGGLLVPDGAVAGTAGMAGMYEFAFDMTGGSAHVYVGGVLAGEASGTGEKLIRFNVVNADDEIRFVYTPDAGSTAILKKLANKRGFIITFW